MKLVKSLILGSTAGVLAVAGAQAADLPSRKAAPVEYVRICDAFGTGYFYIPGTDTCLRIGGRVRAEYRWTSQDSQFTPGGTFVDAAGAPITAATVGRVYSTTYGVVPSKLQDQSGFRVRGRIELDARTQTAWGTLRTFFRFEINNDAGRYVNNTYGGSPLVTGTGDVGNFPYIDKAFIQFAGITAGRAQSQFDFFADNYGYQDIRGSDASILQLAYTATFGGGFSATISLEDPAGRRAGVLSNPAIGGAVNALAFPGTYIGGTYVGTTWPDVVGVLRVDQPWGAAQLSGVVHNQESAALFTNAAPLGGATFGATGTRAITAGGDSVGFAIQGGVQIKLPMLAAGDDLWLQATYAHGALDFQQVGAQEFGRYPNGSGWRSFNGDGESVFYVDGFGNLRHSIPNSWSAVAAINHYFTPTFATSLRASYLNVSYGNGARFPYSGAAGVSVAGVPALANNWSEWRVGLNPEWYPVKGLTFGFELMYVHLNQKAPLISGLNGTVLTYGGSLIGVAPTPGVKAWNSNTNGWEARLRVQRDF